MRHVTKHAVHPRWYIYDEEYDLDNVNNDDNDRRDTRGSAAQTYNDTSTWYTN